MQRLPVGLALRGTLLRRQGAVMGWHGHGERPIRQLSITHNFCELRERLKG